MSGQELEIRLLGPLEVVAGGVPLELPPSRKARALLAYLVASERPHGRSALCDLLWRDVDDPRAGLRWALSMLRRVVDCDEHPRIVTSRDRVEFDASRAVVDLLEVRAAVPGDPADASLESLERAARLFRGAFLESLDVPGARQYDAWCMGMRERTRKLQLAVLATLTTRLRGDPEAALPHAFARLRLDPFAEGAYISAMEVLGELGRVDQGLELYERCRRTFEEELGISPSPELDAARGRLRRLARASRRVDSVPDRRTAPGPDPDAAGVGGALSGLLSRLSPPEGLSQPGPGDPPLVGRDEEMEILAQVVGLAGPGAPGARPVILVTGEPGIGKTRLLRELVGRVRSKGGWVLASPVFETEEVRPYGPWIDLIRALPPGVPAEGAERHLATLLAAPGPGPPEDGPTRRAQLFDAVAGLLGRLTDAGGPGLVVLDDVQWLDPSSATMLHYVARTLSQAPLTLALAARLEEIEEDSAPARILRSLDQSGRLRRISLGRLGAADTATLVQAVDDTADASRVFATSEGNPLFTLALAGSLGTGTACAPRTIEDELAARLEKLDPEARSLLPWIAALGRVFQVPILVHVVDRPAPDIVEALDRLERRGILRAAGADRYDFTHSLLRQAAYQRLSEPARRAIHRAIARALDGADAPDGGTSSAVAHHAASGGLPELAARAYAEAAEQCLWLFAFDEAAELVDRGLAQVEGLPDETRIPLEMGLLRIFGFRSMKDRRPDDVEARVRRVTREARDAGLRGVVAVGHAALMEMEYQRGALKEAARSSVSAARAGKGGEPVAAIRALTETAACLLLVDQAPEDARRLASEAFLLAETHDVEMDVLALARAFLHHHDGELEEASRAFREVVRLGRRDRDRWWECPALTRMTMVELDRGDLTAALERAREAEKLADRLGDDTEAVFARGLGAVASAHMAVEAGAESPEGEASHDGTGEALQEVDAALRELRTLDSLWAIGQLQAYAAEEELGRGRPDAARTRAEEAAGAARVLEQPSLLAVARGLLVRSALVEGDVAEARRLLDAQEGNRPLRQLSDRARRSLRRARRLAAR